MPVIVQLWKKGRLGEPYSLITTRRVDSPEELRYLEERYDVEWIGIADDQVEEFSTRSRMKE